jgi:hypothetical protein
MNLNLKLWVLALSIIMLLATWPVEAKTYLLTIGVVTRDYPIIIKTYEDLLTCRRYRREYLHLLSMAYADKAKITCTPKEK